LLPENDSVDRRKLQPENGLQQEVAGRSAALPRGLLSQR
jgi:hypothetical protein